MRSLLPGFIFWDGTRLYQLLARLPYAAKLACFDWYRPLDLASWVAKHVAHGATRIRGEYQIRYALPRNAGSLRRGTPFASKRFSRAKAEGAFLAELDDCWIVRTRYDWGGSEFCICTHQGQPIRFHGLISDASNFAMRRALDRAIDGEYKTLERATWAVGYWYTNYYHWFAEWLPRIVLALEEGLPAQSILLPPLVNQWAEDSLRLLGINPGRLPEDGDAWRVGRLTFVGESVHHGPAHRAVMQRLSARMILPDGQKKIWISRRDAQHRRLLQEADIEAWLAGRGWEIVQMERLDLETQLKVMAGARALAGVHGAGLTNMLFVQRPIAVLEIGLNERPSPEYYHLASCLGHSYWYVSARSAGRHRSLLHDDIIAPVDEVKKAVSELETFLEQRPAA